MAEQRRREIGVGNDDDEDDRYSGVDDNDVDDGINVADADDVGGSGGGENNSDAMCKCGYAHVYPYRYILIVVIVIGSITLKTMLKSRKSRRAIPSCKTFFLSLFQFSIWCLCLSMSTLLAGHTAMTGAYDYQL